MSNSINMASAAFIEPLSLIEFVVQILAKLLRIKDIQKGYTMRSKLQHY